MTLIKSYSVVLTRSSFYSPIQQRLIGYVGGSSIHCGICRAVDERTYWTSAFSTPQDAQDESWSFKSQQQSPTYYACVSVRNTGLRSAWIYAVAMRPNADSNISLTPLSGVSIRPSRFVLQPNQSQVICWDLLS